MTEPSHVIVGEPSYLRELRSTGRSQAYATAVKLHESRIRSEEGDSEEEDDNDDEERLRKLAEEEELTRQKREAEEKLMRERPPALLVLEESLNSIVKKLAKYERQVVDWGCIFMINLILNQMLDFGAPRKIG